MTNIIQAQFSTAAPVDEQQEIINQIITSRAAGVEFDLFSTAKQINLTASMTRVRDQLIALDFCDKREWNAAVKAAKVFKELGCNPANALELVDFWIKKERFTADYQKRMRRTAMPVYQGAAMTPEARQDRTLDNVARVIENFEVNTETLKRDCRMASAKHGLGFSIIDIDDAVTAWFEKAVQDRLLEISSYVMFRGSANSVENTTAWSKAVSQFDLDDHDAAFVEAVLKKFIWQVKRKMFGLPISNHLMPVLLGPQGVGKSTFVTQVLLKPIEELVGNTDFKMLEEARNTEQWRNFVLFLDEMGYAGKADIDNVKNKITAPFVAGRPMRSNDNVMYKQNATLIGCSNKEIDQLIRDETGNRRFAALRFSSKPDWSLLDGLNPDLLWFSVDEQGPDPIKAVQAELSQRQEAAREKSQVEEWLDHHPVAVALQGKKQAAETLYQAYAEWSETYFGGRQMDYRMWGKEFTRLIKAGQIADWAKVMPGNKAHYVYK